LASGGSDFGRSSEPAEFAQWHLTDNAEHARIVGVYKER
jgi:hypothetical protein